MLMVERAPAATGTRATWTAALPVSPSPGTGTPAWWGLLLSSSCCGACSLLAVAKQADGAAGLAEATHPELLAELLEDGAPAGQGWRALAHRRSSSPAPSARGGAAEGAAGTGAELGTSAGLGGPCAGDAYSCMGAGALAGGPASKSPWALADPGSRGASGLSLVTDALAAICSCLPPPAAPSSCRRRLGLPCSAPALSCGHLRVPALLREASSQLVPSAGCLSSRPALLL
jgi:hypothetical protein